MEMLFSNITLPNFYSEKIKITDLNKLFRFYMYN